MAGVTRVGPSEPGDVPRRKKRWFEHIWTLSWYAWLFGWALKPFMWPLAWRAHEITAEPEEKAPDHSWTGLPEADLTDEQREVAAERMKREDAIRRAKREL